MGWGWKTPRGDRTHFVPSSDSTQTHTLCGLCTVLEWQGDPDENEWLPRCRKCERIFWRLDSGGGKSSKWDPFDV